MQDLAELAEYHPASHPTHTIADADPAAHPSQLDVPASAWNMPATQLTHADAPAAEKVPATQLTQLLPSVDPRYVPAWQPVQPLEPADE